MSYSISIATPFSKIMLSEVYDSRYTAIEKAKNLLNIYCTDCISAYILDNKDSFLTLAYDNIIVTINRVKKLTDMKYHLYIVHKDAERSIQPDAILNTKEEVLAWFLNHYGKVASELKIPLNPERVEAFHTRYFNNEENVLITIPEYDVEKGTHHTHDVLTYQIFKC